LVPLERLHELCRRIIIRDVEPEAMRNRSRHTLTQAERVSTDEICTFRVRVIQGVEEEWSGWAEEILDMLLEGIDHFARWVFSDLIQQTRPEKKKSSSH